MGEFLPIKFWIKNFFFQSNFCLNTLLENICKVYFFPIDLLSEDVRYTIYRLPAWPTLEVELGFSGISSVWIFTVWPFKPHFNSFPVISIKCLNPESFLVSLYRHWRVRNKSLSKSEIYWGQLIFLLELTLVQVHSVSFSRILSKNLIIR